MIKKLFIISLALFSIFFLFSEIDSYNDANVLNAKAMNAQDFPTNI
jgi:hypothetical protein